MTKEEITDALSRVKFCMKHRLTIEIHNRHAAGLYVPAALVLRFSENLGGFIYTVEMQDPKRKNSTITIGLDEADWPTEGGGFILGKKTE